jgi:hypothetical protein
MGGVATARRTPWREQHGHALVCSHNAEVVASTAATFRSRPGRGSARKGDGRDMTGATMMPRYRSNMG